jgi:hypothetical protein
MANQSKRKSENASETHDHEHKETSRKGLNPKVENDIPNDLDSVERGRQRQRINDLARDNQHGRGQDEDERSGQGNQGGHGNRGG